MIKGPLNLITLLSSIVVTVSLTMSHGYAAAGVTTHTFETEVKEVRASNVNGRNHLLLEIDAVTGPTGCRNSSVVLATQHLNKNTQAEIETVALKAFLTSESVVVSVTTQLGHCIDGKPLVTSLKLLNMPAPIGDAPY